MADLLLVADGAYPHPDYSFLPAHIRVWAGYLGGHTPHAWTAAEVDHLEATGREWWGIWTAPDRQAINAGQGGADAADTIATLMALRYPKIRPVFYDVEYGTWHADPAGAEAAADRWKRDVAAAGWRHAYWYGPLASSCDWVADWKGFRPTVLPAGRIGVQYDHALSNDRYDISVFNPAVLTNPGGPIMTQPQVDAINAKLDALAKRLDDWDATHPDAVSLGTVLHRLTGLRDGDAGHADLPDILTALQGLSDDLALVAQAVHGITVPPVAGTFTISGAGAISSPTTPGG